MLELVGLAAAEEDRATMRVVLAHRGKVLLVAQEVLVLLVAAVAVQAQSA